MSPLSLVSHGATQNSHQRMLNNPQMGMLPNELEQRMLEYIKMIQQPKEAARKFQIRKKFLSFSSLFSSTHRFTFFHCGLQVHRVQTVCEQQKH